MFNYVFYCTKSEVPSWSIEVWRRNVLITMEIEKNKNSPAYSVHWSLVLNQGFASCVQCFCSQENKTWL